MGEGFSCACQDAPQLSGVETEVACVITVATEMDVSPAKQQRAPKSVVQEDLRRVAARQQRFMAQMLGKEGTKPPWGALLPPAERLNWRLSSEALA